MAVSRRLFNTLTLAGLATLVSQRAMAQCGASCRAGFNAVDEKAFREMIAKTPIVDVHGHIFNASDLPIMEWLNEIELEAKISEAGVPGNFKGAVDSFLRGLTNLNFEQTIEKLKVAVPASVEAAALDAVLKSGQARTTYVDARGRPTMIFYQQLIKEALRIPGEESAAFLELACSIASKDSQGQALPTTYTVAMLKRGNARAQAIVGSRYFNAVTRPLALSCTNTGTERVVNQINHFSQSLTRPRVHNFANWSGQYSGVVMEVGRTTPSVQNGFPQLMVPAILDVDFWLRFEREETKKARAQELLRQRSPIADQVEATSRLSALNPGLIAPFVGFDPWRHVDDLAHNARTGVTLRKTALDVVKDAILSKGFVGVKLYPVMGFRPYGNAVFDDADGNDQPFPKYLTSNARLAQYADGFGRKLDEALDELYKFCVENEVPIMAHCTDSKGPFEATFKGQKLRSSERSHPKYWRPLLLAAKDGQAPKYPSLRLNLAHMTFGTGGHGGHAGEASWSSGIKELLENCPNVFGDASYLSDILSEGNSRRHCGTLDAFAKSAVAYFKRSEGVPYSCYDKVMYGSDWYMPAMQRNYETFLNVMARTYYDGVAKATGEGREQAELTRLFLSSNALRFLGVANPNSPAHHRFRSFFEGHPDLDAGQKDMARRRIERLVEAALV